MENKSNPSLGIRNTEKEKTKVLSLLNKIKKITNRPHIHNLIEALEKYYNHLKAKH